jgi:hypothetical protein
MRPTRSDPPTSGWAEGHGRTAAGGHNSRRVAVQEPGDHIDDSRGSAESRRMSGGPGGQGTASAASNKR